MSTPLAIISSQVRVRPQLDAIPAPLRQLPFGLWLAEPDMDANGIPKRKPTGQLRIKKAPRDARGRHLSTNSTDSWLSFSECQAAYASGEFSGVGVLLQADSAVVGVDLDNVRGLMLERPELRDWLRNARSRLTYCERSPSGTGLRLFLRAALPGHRGRRDGGVEVYSDKRFLTVTGMPFKWKGDIVEGQELVNQLLELIGPPVTPAATRTEFDSALTEPPHVATVEALVAWARGAHTSLWNGQTNLWNGE